MYCRQHVLQLDSASIRWYIPVNFPRILLHTVRPHSHLFYALIRNSSIYGATMPHLRAVIATFPSTLRGDRMRSHTARAWPSQLAWPADHRTSSSITTQCSTDRTDTQRIS